MVPPFPLKFFLTGLPGCGKTTIIKGVARRFPDLVTGFYTEEVRDEGGQRIGFDLVSHTGDRAVFARKGGKSRARVGKYSVFLEPLEEWGLDLLRPCSDRPLVILDEVGKMECLSRPFQERVLGLIGSAYPILGSVALKGTGLIRGLHERADVECLEVTPENRASLAREMEEMYGDYLRSSLP